MSIKDKLQIILITYNRAHLVQKTFEQLFECSSPIKNYDFLVLDNNSTDNTEKIVKTWQRDFSNITYIKNKYNVGVTGNIVKAMEYANKDYVWIIGDDDLYDFSNWQEVEYAINNEEKIICVSRYAIPNELKEDVSSQLFQLTFITGGIYSTSLFNDTIMRNAYENIYTLFPYMVPVVQHINNGGHIYVVAKAISNNGYKTSGEIDYSYTRGVKNLDDVYIRTRSMCWIVGYCNILSQLKDRKLKEQAIDRAIVNKDIYGSFKNFYKCMQMYHSNDLFMQFIDVYINISDKHKKRLKMDYLQKMNSENCKIAQFSFIELVVLLIKKFLKQIYSLEKTQKRRYLTIMGFRITTKR